METVQGLKSQPQNDFRRYLQDELIRRTKANPKYSLRAFARTLGIQPNFLSKLLLGQRSITVNTVQRLGLKLGLGPKEIERFSQKIPPRTNGRKEFQKAILTPAPDYQALMFDHYQVISDWHHFAMLELASVDNFNSSPKWIARVLGISVTEVNAAIERLKRLDFLEIGDDGKWNILDTGNTTTIGTEVTASA